MPRTKSLWSWVEAGRHEENDTDSSDSDVSSIVTTSAASDPDERIDFDDSDISDRSEEESSRSNNISTSSSDSESVQLSPARFDVDSNSSRSEVNSINSPQSVRSDSSWATSSSNHSIQSNRTGRSSRTASVSSQSSRENFEQVSFSSPTPPRPSHYSRNEVSADESPLHDQIDVLGIFRSPTPQLRSSPELSLDAVISPLFSSPLPSPSMSAAVASSSEMRSAAGTGTMRQRVTYECSVCLESLDTPASIDIPAGPSYAGTGSPPGRGNRAGRGRGGRISTAAQTSRNSQRGSANEGADLTDVVTTSCGHMYHKVCIEKWFLEQGRRTCPSCRKSVPASKLIKLFPSISADPMSRSYSDPILSVASNNQPSTSRGITSAPSQTTGNRGGVSNAGQPVTVDCNCQELKQIHQTLINDYSDLQQRYDTLMENDELKEAQLQSLEVDNALKIAEINNLKRELEEARGGVNGHNAKRRRR